MKEITTVLLLNSYFINVCDTPSAIGYFAVTSKSLIPGSTLRRSMDPSGTTWKKNCYNVNHN